MRIAKAITLTDEERTTLTKWSRGRSTPARLVQRAEVYAHLLVGEKT